MASNSVLAPGVTAVRALLAANATFMASIQDLYPNTNGDPVDGSAQPYASVEAAGEVPFNTMGDTSGLKWGGVGTIHLRLSSLSRSDAEIATIAGLARAALEGQAITVSGFGSAILEFTGLNPMADLIAGRKTREWVLTFELTAHQGNP